MKNFSFASFVFLLVIVLGLGTLFRCHFANALTLGQSLALFFDPAAAQSFDE